MIKGFFLAVVLFISTWSYGQETVEVVVDDLETWSSLNLNYKVNKQWGLNLQTQLRLKDDSSVVDQYFGQLDVDYSPFKHFGFAVGLRYIKKNDTEGKSQGYRDYFRYNLDGIYKHKINDFSLKYRIRYQNKNELDIDEDKDAKEVVRFKVGLGYNIKKWKLDPEFSGELFRSLGEGADDEFTKYRLTLGTSFKVHKSARMGVFYRYEKELNESYPQAANIIGVKYTYNLK